MDVARASAAALEEIEDHLLVVAAGYPMLEQGEMFQELCIAFHGRAIFFLLGEMDLTHYRWNLQRSAQARSFYLRKIREQRGDDPVFTALSRTEGLFCAIAIGDLKLLQEVKAMSAQSWMPDGEYEDDYWYYAMVHAIATGDRTTGLRNFEKMTTALDGLDDTRLPMCDALLNNREAEFWPAFSDFVDDRHESALIEHDDGRLVGEPWLAAFQHVSVEAIVWLKIAATLAFRAPEAEYRMCPSIALNLPEETQCPDIFSEMESRFRL